MGGLRGVILSSFQANLPTPRTLITKVVPIAKVDVGFSTFVPIPLLINFLLTSTCTNSLIKSNANDGVHGCSILVLQLLSAAATESMCGYLRLLFGIHLSRCRCRRRRRGLTADLKSVSSHFVGGDLLLPPPLSLLLNQSFHLSG